jgi:hypothetical protein
MHFKKLVLYSPPLNPLPASQGGDFDSPLLVERGQGVRLNTSFAYKTVAYPSSDS